jgi:hypothetical protein
MFYYGRVGDSLVHNELRPLFISAIQSLYPDFIYGDYQTSQELKDILKYLQSQEIEDIKDEILNKLNIINNFNLINTGIFNSSLQCMKNHILDNIDTTYDRETLIKWMEYLNVITLNLN